MIPNLSKYANNVNDSLRFGVSALEGTNEDRQKLGLGAFLCLSIFMCITAAIRVSGFLYQRAFDGSWIRLRREVEACVAVTMIFLTALRSVFVGHAPKPKPKLRPGRRCKST